MALDASAPQDRAIIMLAREWGVSPSVFMGRDTGPAWTDDDRQAAFSLHGYESGLCPGCRNPLSQTSIPENEFRYRAEPPLRCHYCTAAGIGQDEAQSHPQPSALLIPVVLNAD